MLLRVVCGGFLVIDGIAKCQAGQPLGVLIAALFAIVDGALLVTGLWTPIAGPLVIVLSAWGILVQHQDPHPGILLAAIGAALNSSCISGRTTSGAVFRKAISPPGKSLVIPAPRK